MSAGRPVVIRPDDLHQGPLDAPLQLVEYADFECPYSGQAFWEVRRVGRMLGAQLCFAFRHFPLTQIHPHAYQAHEAAQAAASEGRFWEMHELLFQNQVALELPALYAYARELGLDMTRFSAALEEHAFEARIRRDFLRGIRDGVNGTPTLFINGVRYDGKVTTEALLEVLRIEPALAPQA